MTLAVLESCAPRAFATNAANAATGLLVALALAACRTTVSEVYDTAGDMYVGEGHVHYESWGSGEPVVLIHGNGLDRRVWDDVVAQLSRGQRVIRYDRRGYGFSSPPLEAYSEVDDLGLLLDRIGLERSHLIGISGGGDIALDFALAHPDRVRSLVLVATSVDGYRYSGHEAQQIDAIFKTALEIGDDEAIEAWVDKPGMLARPEASYLPRQKLRTLLSANRLVFHFPRGLREAGTPAIRLLSELTVPTLILCGALDSPDNLEIAAMLEEKIPDARRIVVEDCGHMIPMERPERFLEHLRPFLRNHQPAAATKADESPMPGRGAR